MAKEVNDGGNQEVWNSRKAPAFLWGVMNWDRGQRGLWPCCEGHQYPVMWKQSQQVAGHHYGHITNGSAWGLGTSHLALLTFLPWLCRLLFVLINVRQFKRPILIRKKCKDICGDHKSPGLCRLNEVTYPTLYEIIVYCTRSHFGKYNHAGKLEWNEHGIKGKEIFTTNFMGP